MAASGMAQEQPIENKPYLAMTAGDSAIPVDHLKVILRPLMKDELADSSVNLFCRPWVKTEDYWNVHWDLTHQVKERFDAEGISFPFPQRDVHVDAPAHSGIAQASDAFPST